MLKTDECSYTTGNSKHHFSVYDFSKGLIMLNTMYKNNWNG